MARRYGQIFNWLLRSHIANLEILLEDITDGEHEDAREDYFMIGEYENKKVRGGLLIVGNGEIHKRFSQEDLITNPRRGYPKAIDCSSYEEFDAYLNSRSGMADGATLVERTGPLENRKTICIKAGILKNTLSDIKVNYSNYIPEDFLHPNPNDAQELSLGAKSTVAIEYAVCNRLNLHTFLIRQTAYNNLATGKLVHFDDGGLVEEAFFRHVNHHEAHHLSKVDYINQDERIIGIYRFYDRKNGKVTTDQRLELPFGLHRAKTIGLY